MIFVSTSCYKERKSVKDVLINYSKIGVSNIELGAAHQYEEGIIDFIKEYKKEHNAEFTLHSYFPPEKDPFIVNLASSDPVLLERSRKHVLNMIDVSGEIGARICSFHSGFLVDPKKVGTPLDKSNPSGYEEGYDTFLESIAEICSHAKSKGVTVAMEPNEMSEYNLVNGKNELLLMCELHEIKRLYRDLEQRGIDNLNILLDLAHLKVTANNLDFDAYEFIEGIKDRVVEVHVHDNDGKTDQHRKLSEGCFALEILNRKLFKEPIITLEAGNLDLDDIKAQLDLLNNL